MKVLHEIKDMLCDELEHIADSKTLTHDSLEVLDVVIDIWKDIDTIHAMEQEYPDESGYSQGFYGRMPVYMYDDGITGSSYKGRTTNMRKSYNDGYSGDTKDELMRLMDMAKSDKERDAIKNALEHMR